MAEMAGGGGAGIGAEVGFAGAAGALAGIQHENANLAQGVKSGALKMNPESANKAARVYFEKADEILVLSRRADDLQSISGLGDYDPGRALSEKFGLKASNGNTGAADLLRQLSEELKRKGDLFQEAAKDYVVTDESIGENLQRGMA